MPCLSSVLVSLLLLAPVPERAYQKRADRARWEFSDQQASLLSCLRAYRGPYQIEEVQTGDFTSQLRFRRGGKTVHSITCHAGTVFVLREDILYHAVFSPYSTGCAIVAHDLARNKTLWKANLKGMGPIEHSKYHNAINLAIDGRALRIYGKESAGRYIEYVDMRKGQTVGHKVFEE
jgi:hypothetical protein